MTEELASFRGGGTPWATVTLGGSLYLASGGDGIYSTSVGRAFFYQPTPRSPVFVAITAVVAIGGGALRAAAALNTRQGPIDPDTSFDILVLSTSPGFGCLLGPPLVSVFNPSGVSLFLNSLEYPTENTRFLF